MRNPIPQRRPGRWRRSALTALTPLALLQPGLSQADDQAKLSGDLGLGVDRVAPYVRGASRRTDVVPYVNLEYGRWFARIDTLGARCLPVGWGHVEAVVQIRTDGYRLAGRPDRADSTPVGVGTLQITPVGAFGLQVLHDFGPSRGNLVQARYLAELPLGRVRIYPELGAEYQDRRYVRYYNLAADGGATGRAALNPYVGGMVETEITPHWVANVYLRHRLLDTRATDGAHRRPTDVLAALAYRF